MTNEIKTSADTIDAVMATFCTEYSPHFAITIERSNLWQRMLSKFAPKVIQSAAHILMSLPNEFPPRIGMMHDKCASISEGELFEPTSSDAWGNILKAVASNSRGDDINLTDMERAAYKKTGDGTLAGIGKSQNIDATRANFERAFNALVKKQRLERAISPDILAFANSCSKSQKSRLTSGNNAMESQPEPHRDRFKKEDILKEIAKFKETAQFKQAAEVPPFATQEPSIKNATNDGNKLTEEQITAFFGGDGLSKIEDMLGKSLNKMRKDNL
ncbi:MAG: hypothetical protein GY841_15550 [FCB group bacterium]|nr:hypothetical protein [FCB group bacterium]